MDCGRNPRLVLPADDGCRSDPEGAVKVSSFPPPPLVGSGENPILCRIGRQRCFGRRPLHGGAALGELGVWVHLVWFLGGRLRRGSCLHAGLLMESFCNATSASAFLSALSSVVS